MADTDLILAAQTAVTLPSPRPDGSVGPLSTDSRGRLRVASGGGALVGSSDPNYSVDGDEVPLSVDSAGYLRTVDRIRDFPVITGTTRVVDEFVAVNTTQAATVMMTLRNTGTTSITSTTWAVAFEGSADSTNGTDGTWVDVQMSRTNSNISETSMLLPAVGAGSTPLYGWQASVTSYRWFRVRVYSTTGLATAIPTWTITRSSIPDPKYINVGTDNVSVTNNPVIFTRQGSVVNYVTTASTNLGPMGFVTTSGINLMTIAITNTSASTIYVKLYNLAGTPVLASSVPSIIIPVPANSVYVQDFGTLGMRFSSNSIGRAVTGAMAATDTTAVAAGCLIHMTYTAPTVI